MHIVPPILFFFCLDWSACYKLVLYLYCIVNWFQPHYLVWCLAKSDYGRIPKNWIQYFPIYAVWI